MQPALWAALCGIGLAAVSISLPASLSALVEPLAAVHAPLALTAMGIVAGSAQQQVKLSRQLLAALLYRHLGALLVGTVATLAGSLQAAGPITASIMASLGTPASVLHTLSLHGLPLPRPDRHHIMTPIS